MNLKEAEKLVIEQLQTVYDESESSNIALLIIEDVTGFSRSDFLLNKQTDITDEQHSKLLHHVERLKQHEPVQYIIQKTWFYGMELYVDRDVLIPRPETEELVDWIITDIKATGQNVFEKTATDADLTRQLKILDIGTGSGCIALALKKTMPKAEVWGCDVSEEALNVARRNGADLNVRVDFQGTNLLDERQQKLLPTVDIIVSNPPYIPLSDKSSMRENVVNHEPHTALFVPDDDALIFYKAIVQFAKKRLYEGGIIYLEIHENLAQQVAQLFSGEGYEKIEVKKDMQGKERMVRITSPRPSPAKQEREA